MYMYCTLKAHSCDSIWSLVKFTNMMVSLVNIIVFLFFFVSVSYIYFFFRRRINTTSAVIAHRNTIFLGLFWQATPTGISHGRRDVWSLLSFTDYLCSYERVDASTHLVSRLAVGHLLQITKHLHEICTHGDCERDTTWKTVRRRCNTKIQCA